MGMHSVADYNLLAAWVGIALGMGAGALVGLMFDREGFAGGCGSWRRRLMRLGHVSFFGLAFLNVVFYLTAPQLDAARAGICSPLLIAGAITMPLVCYLSAWRPAFRHVFFVPVSCLLIAALLVTWTLIEGLS